MHEERSRPAPRSALPLSCPALSVVMPAHAGHPVTRARRLKRKRCLAERPVFTGSSAFADDDNRGTLLARRRWIRTYSVDLATLTVLACCILEARNSLEPFGSLDAVIGERLPSGSHVHKHISMLGRFRLMCKRPAFFGMLPVLRDFAHTRLSVSEHANRRNASPPRGFRIRGHSNSTPAGWNGHDT